MASERIRVAALHDLRVGAMRYIAVDGLPIALANVGGVIYAFSDTCCHEGGSLSSGTLIDATVACPWHGWTYDVRTGKSLVPPVGLCIPTYPVHIVDDAIYIEIDWGEWGSLGRPG